MISFGTYRHLTQCSTSAGQFVILAIDHRSNLRGALDANAPQPLTDEAFIRFKMDVLKNLNEKISGVLIDPTFGIGPGVSQGLIAGNHGLISPLEVTDYDIHPSKRERVYIENWSVKKIKQVGGSGVKLLLAYNPDAADVQEKYDEVIRIGEQCRYHQIPFFLEPIAYSLDPQQQLSSHEKRQMVVTAAETFSQLPVDVLKLEFPVHPDEPEQVWLSALEEVNQASGNTPWALLSAGVSYDVFKKQTVFACQAGASGVIVGRAVWTETISLQGEERAIFLKNIARQRMQELADICSEHAFDWRKKVGQPRIDLA